MNLFNEFGKGLSYADFLQRYANDGQKARWQQVYNQVVLSDPQKQLLKSFRRTMKVLCLAGAWCGDCSGQCPIFTHFVNEAPVIEMKYLDRDEHPHVQEALRINGGNRVPVLVFFSEDGSEIARFGDRTLSKYRILVGELGEGCPTGLAFPNDPLLGQITQDWLNEFERVHCILRLSPRLRKIYGD